MMLKTKSAVLVALIALAGTSAAAQEGAKNDSEANSGITREQVVLKAAQKFDRADINGDGVLDTSEIRAQREAFRDRKMERARSEEKGDRHGEASHEKPRDARGEGHGRKFFDRIDADGDGAISFGEFQAAGEKFRERHTDGHPPAPGHPMD